MLTRSANSIIRTCARRIAQAILGCGLLGMLLASPASAQQTVAPAPPPADQDNGAIRFRLPTITVTAQKEPEDEQKTSGKRHGRARARRSSSADIRTRQRRGRFRAQHLLHRVHRAQAEQRALPRHRLEPEQPGRHDLHRRRAAAQRELVEHRACSTSIRSSSCADRRARCSAATRSAAWSTSRAAGRRSSDWTGDVDAPFGNFGPRDVRGSASGPLIARQAGARVSASATRRRDGFTDQRRDRSRPRLPVGAVRQGPGALDAGRELGSRGSS